MMSRALSIGVVISLTLSGGLIAQKPTAPVPKVAYAEPGISPDGREIAFVSGGDIWTVPATGGEARLLVSNAATESRPLYSPDGKSLGFVSTRTGNGDLYVLTLENGDLRRVTYDDGFEALNGWAPDGRSLYFTSGSQDIGGMGDIFRIAVDGGTAMPVTGDAYLNEFNGAPAADGQRLAFSARGIASQQWWRHGHSHIDESELWLIGGSAGYEQITPRGAKALWPMWGADGRTLFFVSDRGGPENIWKVPVPAAAAAQPAPGAAVTSFTDGRVLWPTISRDGKTIAFERDFGIWTLDTATGRAQALTISRRGAPAATGVEHTRLTNGFADLALSPDGKKVAFAARGDLFAASAKDGGDATRITSTPAVETTPLWTPDSRRLVYVAELGTTSELRIYDFMPGGKEADAATSTGTASSSNASNSSATSAGSAPASVSAPAPTDIALTTGHRDYAPALSPNGAQVAFLRGGNEVCVVALGPATPSSSGAAATSASARAASAATAGTTRCLAKVAAPTALDATHVITWSPDNKWIAFMASGAKGFTNAQVIAAPTATGTVAEPRPISFLANVGAESLAWSPDGTFLLFNTGQRTEEGQVARVDLVLRTPKFREDQFRELFPSQPSTPERPARTSETTTAETQKPADKTDDAKTDAKADARPDAKPDAAKKPPKPTEIVFDDIRQRLGYLPIGVDVNGLAISPDGKTLLVTASSAGQVNLYTYSLDDLARERPVARQLTSTAGDKSDAQFSPDGKEVYYLDAGRIQVVAIERREPRPLAVTAELDVDFPVERNAVFTQAWSLLDENFYDSAFHGAPWGQLRDRFAPYAAAASTADELRRITNLMIGELNASHLGMNPAPNNTATTGRLGVRFDRDEYARSGRLTIADIIPLGPAAVTRALSPGDTIVAVNGTPVTRTTNLDRLLEHTVGKRVALTIEPKGQTAAGARRDIPREVAVQPVNLTTERGLRYRQWVESRREYVAKISGGRLGYVHMPDMGAASLAQLYVDLDVENHARDGVVIDVRNNNGGFVNAYALDVFTRRPYLNMTLRGRPTAPARGILGQRALESATILVTNQHSLSDAEDFAEGYRRLKLGKVVGEPTAGWIIYTWNTRLMDGSVLRLPRMRITDGDGKDMERAPRPVDLPTTRVLGEAAAGKDTQLDVAVRELLAQLGAGGKAGRPSTTSLR